MTPTTVYATWARLTRTLTPYDVLLNYAGDAASDYDLGAVETDYRAAIAALLPGTMILAGEDFIAETPDPAIPAEWADTLREQLEDLDLGPMFEAADMGALLAAHYTYVATLAPDVAAELAGHRCGTRGQDTDCYDVTRCRECGRPMGTD